jgi:general secretion pathway protein B
MSYILDALKKLEKKRHHGSVPDLLTFQDLMVQEPKKRPLWPYLFLIVLLLNAVILVWWLSPWQSKKTEMVAQPTAVIQHESKASESEYKVTDIRSPEVASSHDIGKTINPALKSETVTAKTDETRVKVAQQNQRVQAKDDLNINVPDRPAQTIDMSRHHEIPPVVSKQTPAANYFSDKQQNGTHNSTSAEQRIFNLNDLPSSVQQSLPPFTISVFIYSEDPNYRMVKINGQMLREGQDLTNGLKLKEITPDGVIFSYQNYRFRVGLK